jgi:hypothetical protein
MIPRARVASIPKVFRRILLNLWKIFKIYGAKKGIGHITKMAFFDVENKSHDYLKELESIRRAFSKINQEIALSIIDIDDFLLTNFPNYSEEINDHLGELFLKHGSDKSISGQLFRLYGCILTEMKNQEKSISLLEIGVGTNNVDIDSNMGVFGIPGASLRAFREFLRDSDKVFGADVDKRILFYDPYITTTYVDQLKTETVQELAIQVGELDLVIDDGLHILESNVNTLFGLISNVKSKGWYVVEDISNLPENLYLWSSISLFLEMKGFRSSLIQHKHCLLFFAQNMSQTD